MPITQQENQNQMPNPQLQNAIANGIQTIIDQRKGLGDYVGQGHLAKIDNCLSFFRDLKGKVQGYETLRLNLIAQEEAKSGEYYSFFQDDPTLIDRIKAASATSVLAKLDECIKECDRLHARFDRDTINISVIGLARQGKSCLLQAISGLEDRVIPTSNGGDCTGTTSIICNEPGTRAAHAEVVFFSADEILEAVRKYIEAIGLNCVVGSFDGIPLLSSIVQQYDTGHLSQLSAEKKALFNHLRKYIEHFEDYRQFVVMGTIPATENEIRQYVAQHDNQHQSTYQYLAVKEVRIYKEFNYAEAGRIQLVDTIGLGDTSLGIKQKMLNTLRNNSDASFWLKLPAATGDHWGVDEVNLYDDIADTMGTELLDKWLYIVLNSSDGLQNATSTQSVRNDIDTLHLHTAGIVEVDCSNRTAVQEKLIIPALQYLATNLTDVDNDMMRKANKLFDDCYSAYEKLFMLAQKIWSDTPQARASLDTFSINKWRDIKPVITEAFTNLYEEYQNQAGLANSKIIELFSKINNEDIPDYNPSLDWYKGKLIGGRDGDFESVYKEALHEVRTKTSARFDNVYNDELLPMQEELKLEVAKILFEKARWGELYKLDDKASVEWLHEFTQKKLKDSPLINAAVEYLLSYQMNLSDLMDYEVEKCLGILNPEDDQYVQIDLEEAGKTGALQSREAKAKFISTTVSNRITKVRKLLRDTDFNITKIPNQSLYARLRKFYEKFINTKETQEELCDFYIKNAATIWRDEYRQRSQNEANLTVLNQWVDKIELINQQRFMLNIQ